LDLLLLFLPKVQYFLDGSLELVDSFFRREGVEAGGVGGALFSAGIAKRSNK